MGNHFSFENNYLPTANIESISPEEVRFDGEVTFTGFGNDTDGTIIAYEWYSDIGGGDEDYDEWFYEWDYSPVSRFHKSFPFGSRQCIF